MTIDPDRHYRTAQRLFDLDPQRDSEAARRLAKALQNANVVDPETLRATFTDQTVTVLGPVPGGAESVDPAKPVIAAGSAVQQALSAGIQPALIVTDLDGSKTAHTMFSRIGVTTAIHAHADNIHRFESLLPELEGPVFGTCQTPPPEDTPVPMHRFGGFTDGDRACFLAAHLGAQRLQLSGWNFEEPVRGGQEKATKLDLAQRLLEDIPIPISFIEPDEPEAKSLEDLDIGEGIGLEFEGR